MTYVKCAKKLLHRQTCVYNMYTLVSYMLLAAAEGVPVNTGRRTYALVCRKLGVNPISAIQRTLSEREIRVRRRGLSACDVLALACALQV